MTKDMVAASWNTLTLTSETSYVDYYGIDVGKFNTSERAKSSNPTNSSWNGGGHKFDMSKSDNNIMQKLVVELLM